MVKPVFLNMRSALRLACLADLTTRLIHGAACLIVTTLFFTGANLSSTFFTQLVSEREEIVSLKTLSESKSESLKTDVLIAFKLRLLTEFTTFFGLRNGKSIVKTKLIRNAKVSNNHRWHKVLRASR